MSAEYDTLYTLLQNAIQKNKSVSDTLSNIIIDIIKVTSNNLITELKNNIQSNIII